LTLYKYILSHTIYGQLELGYAPQEWDSDECFYERSTTYWGIFRSFSTKELTFIKTGADFLKVIFDAEGTEAICNYEVQELDITDYTYKSRYIGIVDFSTYKCIQGSSGNIIKVQIIDNSLVNKIKTRESLEISLSKLIDIEGNSIASFSTEGKTVSIPPRTDYYQATLQAVETDITNRVINLQIQDKQEESIRSVEDVMAFTTIEGAFFSPSFSSNISMLITMAGHINYITGSSGSVMVYLRLYDSSGVLKNEAIVINQSIPPDYPTILINYSDRIPFNLCVDGDYLVMSIYHISATPISCDLTTTINAEYERVITPATYTVKGYQYHEAFTRILQAITGEASPFWSKILGRTDSELINYSVNGLLSNGIVTNGLLIRGFTFGDENVQLKVSLKGLFQSLHSICPLCLGLEEFEGTWRIRIEEMRYAFNDTVFLSIEGATEIIEEVASDLTFSRINIGFQRSKENAYNATKGRYEYNSQASYSTPITTQENTLSQLSPYRADGNGIFSALEKHKTIVAGENSEYDDSNFLITYQTESSQIEREESFTTVENTGNDTNNYNLFYHPARNLRRWGSYIRGALDHYTDKILSFLSSDYNSEAYTLLTGETDTIYEGQDINISDLDDPFFENIYYTFDFVVTPDVMSAMKQVTNHIPNQYMLVRFRANTDEEYKYGWIMKFNSRKSDVKGMGQMKLLKANLTYVTPVIPSKAIKDGLLHKRNLTNDNDNNNV